MGRKSVSRPAVKKEDSPIHDIVKSANEDLKEAIDSYEGDGTDDVGYIMEKVLHASGLLEGTVLIMKNKKI